MKKYFFLLPLLCLTACSTLNIPGKTGFHDYGMPLGTHNMSWPARQQQLESLKNWSAQGSVAAKTNTKGWNASFSWQENNPNYTLQLFGPLGVNRVQLQCTPQQVTLTNTAHQIFTAPTAEVLLEEQLGWQLPVSNLYYWLRGLPSPTDTHFKRSLNMTNHMMQLTQDGWHIIYLRYVSVNGVDLPNRLLLSNGQWQVNIVITQWTI